MRKLFAGLLATSMLAAGTSAFASEVANNDGYVKATGTYSIAADLSDYGSEQMTILIVKGVKNADGSYSLPTTISDTVILYIDQTAANTENIFKNVGILGGTTLADGKYYVKIGGETLSDKGIIVETFTITTTPTGVKVQLGDVNEDEEINGFDLTDIVNHITGLAEFEVGSKSFFIADVNADEEINGFDLTDVVNDITGLSKLGTSMYYGK